jgi:hypothetical protein
MADRSSCPICKKRRPERFCPALGEKICAICCGTEREATLDCPSDCPYLLAAHRYEQEHRKPLPESELPFSDVQFSPDLIYERQPLFSGLAYAIAKFASEHRELADPDVLLALTALAETYRTLLSGIYYEKPPAAPLPAGLYAALANFIQDYKKQEAERSGFSTLKDTEIFYVLVFLARLGRTRTNGRPRARIFLEFLRAQFPQAEELQPAPSRIILP